jgi:hypothetical protein
MSSPRYHTHKGFYTRYSGDAGSMSQGDLVKFIGKFSTDGAGAIANDYTPGATVTYIAGGNYLLTFDEGFAGLQSATASIQAVGAAVDQYAQIGAFTAGVAGACTLELWNCAVALNADMAAGDYFMYEVTLYSEWLD